MKVTIGEIAYARSGDKGGMANVGVAARAVALYPALRRELTSARVQEYFSDRCGHVDRYELANLSALNFLLHGVLGRGGTSTLRLDPQGKALADAISFMEIDLTDEESTLIDPASSTRPNNEG